MRLAPSPLGRVKTARGGGKDEQKTTAAVGCRFRVRMFPERASVESAVLTPQLFLFFFFFSLVWSGSWNLAHAWLAHALVQPPPPYSHCPLIMPWCQSSTPSHMCRSRVCALPLGLIAPAPLHKPLVHDDFNLKCIFALLYMFPLSCPPCFLWVSCGIWVVIPSVYAGCNKYGVKLEVIPRLWRLLSSLWWTAPCVLHRWLY